MHHHGLFNAGLAASSDCGPFAANLHAEQSLADSVFDTRENETSFPQVVLKAQPVCDFIDASLKADRVAGRRNYGWLPPVS
jgi:hypothetical protein